MVQTTNQKNIWPIVLHQAEDLRRIWDSYPNPNHWDISPFQIIQISKDCRENLRKPWQKLSQFEEMVTIFPGKHSLRTDMFYWFGWTVFNFTELRLNWTWGCNWRTFITLCKVHCIQTMPTILITCRTAMTWSLRLKITGHSWQGSSHFSTKQHHLTIFGGAIWPTTKVSHVRSHHFWLVSILKYSYSGLYHSLH